MLGGVERAAAGREGGRGARCRADPDGEKIQKEVSVPTDVPAYTLTKDEAGMVEGFEVRSVAASTEVTSE